MSRWLFPKSIKFSQIYERGPLIEDFAVIRQPIRRMMRGCFQYEINLGIENPNSREGRPHPYSGAIFWEFLIFVLNLKFHNWLFSNLIENFDLSATFGAFEKAIMLRQTIWRRSQENCMSILKRFSEIDRNFQRNYWLLDSKAKLRDLQRENFALDQFWPNDLRFLRFFHIFSSGTALKRRKRPPKAAQTSWKASKRVPEKFF